MYGARFSLAMGISTVAISLAFGALLGVSIAYGGGKVDAIGARLIDECCASRQSSSPS